MQKYSYVAVTLMLQASGATARAGVRFSLGASRAHVRPVGVACEPVNSTARARSLARGRAAYLRPARSGDD